LLAAYDLSGRNPDDASDREFCRPPSLLNGFALLPDRRARIADKMFAVDLQRNSAPGR